MLRIWRDGPTGVPTRRAAAEGLARVRARVRRLRRDRRRPRTTTARSARSASPGLRAGHHGDDLRDRPPVRRAHQPGGDDRLHAHAALPGRATPSPTSPRSSPARRRGALVLLAVWTDKPAAPRRDRARRSAPARALLYEALLTAFLMFVIIAVATDTRAVGRRGRDRHRRHRRARRALRRPDHRRVDEPGPLVRAGARRRASGATSGSTSSGPIVGAALGALAYQLVRGEHPRRARRELMATSCSSACTTPAARR